MKNTDNYFSDLFGRFNIANNEKILDDYWAVFNAEKYYKYKEELKSKGYRVFRNKNGKHKIKFGGC